MRRLLTTIGVLAALLPVGTAGADTAAPLRYGVADDWPKWHPCGDAWWQAAQDIGFQDLRMTVQWDETQPAVIPGEDELSAAVDCARLANVEPILAIYPLHPGAIGHDPAAQASFASFVALVGTAFPGVTDFIVGNEPNVNRFWQPQYLNGRDAAPIDYEHTLAASYDALKTVRPDAVVWGPAISSRGNDNPLATSNPSHSPVRFIEAMGAAYAASGRTEPIFDEFDMHPYPSVQDTSSFAKPFLWPQVGAANLDRVKQALWDAFHDTAQPLPAEYGGGRTASAGLPIDLDEAGEQTTVTGHPDYTRAPENVIPIDETTQAARYVELARIGACDPDVKSILWFPLIDDGGLSDGFQSGELYADLTRKLSYSALKDQIATSGGRCDAPVPGVPRGWVHTTRVSGAAIVKQPSNRPAGAGVTAVFTAAEDVSYTATVVDAATGRRQATGIRRLLTTTGTLRAYRKPPLRFAGPIPAGRYRIRLVLTAAMNPERSTALTTLPFTVAAKK